MLSIGVIGLMLDYYTTYSIIPTLLDFSFLEQIPQASFSVEKNIRVVNEIWSLFIACGLMLFLIELLHIKSKHTIGYYLIELKYKLLLKYYDDMINYYQ